MKIHEAFSPKKHHLVHSFLLLRMGLHIKITQSCLDIQTCCQIGSDGYLKKIICCLGPIASAPFHAAAVSSDASVFFLLLSHKTLHAQYLTLVNLLYSRLDYIANNGPEIPDEIEIRKAVGKQHAEKSTLIA